LRKLSALLILVVLLSLFSSCRRRDTEYVTVALPEKFSAFDTLTMVTSDAAAERVKNLMFNSLVRKDANFEYVGELAKEIRTSEDGTVLTFVLQDGVKFHNGQELTSADVKYTFDELIKANGYKAGSFFDTVPDGPAAKEGEQPKTKRVAHISSIETPDPKTVVFTVTRPALRNQLLSNLVAIPIIPSGSVTVQKDTPTGSGPFRFVSLDSSQNIVELAANPDYWEGAPKVQKLRLKTVTDANSLQAELQIGGVDLAPNPNNISADTLKTFMGSGNLKVELSDGSNIQYLVFNTQSGPLANAKVRQAIAYAIDRQKIVSDLLLGQAKVADSILPNQSWAYSPGTRYEYNPEKAKQLLQEAGYKGEQVVFKFGSGNLAVSNYSQAIQNALTSVGLNVRIEMLEINTIRKELAQGEFMMYTGAWIGGNQDPIFIRDLFSSTKIPGGSVSCCNRSRYRNDQVDRLVEDAVNAVDKAKAKELYGQAWQIISDEVPLLPLWYPSNIVVANKRIDNVKISPSGDWSFIKDITVSN
jgi:peptide/nickel transport system substrate-binding protein